MKGILYITLTLICSISSAQQRYISSAIIAFSGGAYERTIRDINTALEDEETLNADESAKAYFYRAIAMKKLAISGVKSEQLPANPFLSAYNDLIKVKSFELESWSERATTELSELFEGLLAASEEALEIARVTTDVPVKINYYNRAINHLNAAQVIKEDFEVNFLLGITYLALGDLYSQSDETRKIANYRAAARYLDLAFKLKNDCSECLDDLIVVSQNLGDSDKVLGYQEKRNVLAK